MATSLLNRAQISYTFNGSAASAVSNQTNTTLVNQYTMLAAKTTLTPELRAGNNAAYTVRIENNGAGTLSNISAFDNMGMEAGTVYAPLTYVDGSAVFYLNGTAVSGTATVDTDGVNFVANTELAPGDNLLIFYLAELDTAATAPVSNTVTVTASTDATAAAVITGSDTATVTPVTFADVSIFKTADKDTVVDGDTLTYVFTLMNTGFDAAQAVTLTDAFPAEFTVTSISYTIDGVVTPIANTDYTITDPNTLTVPAAGSALTISVPAATEEGPGITTITVNGIIGAVTVN